MTSGSTLTEAWLRVKRPEPGWYWIATQLRNGDLHHACSLAAAFSAARPALQPIYLVVDTPARARIARLYGEDLTAVLVEPELRATLDDWRAFFALNAFPVFGTDAPLLLHPGLHFETFALSNYTTENGLTWMQLYKQVLRLPMIAEPGAPRADADLAARARALCEETGIAEGRSVLLFPYAQSFPVDARAHFARLAVDLAAAGYGVFTSVANGEEPIAGTRPVFVPFDLLLDVADHAGWAVSIRSGVSDITASSRCRKTVVYQSRRGVEVWGVNAMDLCRDAQEIVFAFDLQPPDAFSAAVLAEPARPGPARSRLSDEIMNEAGAAIVRTLDFADLQARPNIWNGKLAAATAFLTATGGVFRIVNLCARDHPRWGRLADEVLQRAARLGDDYFVCRDGGAADFLEQVEAGALACGGYHAAGVWHTLLVIKAQVGRASEPQTWDARRLPLEPIAIGASLDIAQAITPEARLASRREERPMSAGGVQLLSGWHPPEPWGVWTEGRRSTFKLAFAERPTDGLEVELGCRLAISASFPHLRIAARINGAPVSVEPRLADVGADRLTLFVPADLAAQSRSLLVELLFEEVRSPLQQGVNDDPRLLGLGLERVTVQRAGEVSPPQPIVAMRSR